jgi:hypothetical protein
VTTTAPGTAPTAVLVRDVLEADIRRLMARRAALPATWEFRGERAELLAEADAKLEQFNLLVLGR